MNNQNMKVMLLGEPFDGVNTVKVMFVVGDQISVKYARSKREMIQFSSCMMAIKHTIEDINDEYNNGGLSEAMYREKLSSVWLNGCVAKFINQYGMKAVPLDIRNAVNNVEDGLNISAKTSWPAIEYEVLNPDDSKSTVHME